MQIDILTLFPRMFAGIFSESIIKRAQEAKRLKINVYNLRDWSKDKHRKVDDKPYGGGCGMVMSCQPIFDAVEDLKVKGSPYAASVKMWGLGSGDKERLKAKGQRLKVILLTPQGKMLNQNLARKLAKVGHLILICGHYEGIDERVRQALVDEEISIGDYVLTGGEIPAMVLVDAVVRLIPGVLGHKDSNRNESFASNLLEYPQYTRPAIYKSLRVPQILLSGDHKNIELWRLKQSLKITGQKRPDLMMGRKNSPAHH